MVGGEGRGTLVAIIIRGGVRPCCTIDTQVVVQAAHPASSVRLQGLHFNRVHRSRDNLFAALKFVQFALLGQLVSLQPVAFVHVADKAEGGLLGLETQVIGNPVLAYYMIIVRPIPIFLNFMRPDLLLTAIV